MYSGSSKVEASSFMVATIRKWGWALILMPATMDSTYRRLSSRGARLAQLFSLMRLPSSRMATPPRSMAVTSGEATYRRLPAPSITGVMSRPSGRIHGGLDDVDIAPHEFAGGVCQRGLPHSRFAQE